MSGEEAAEIAAVRAGEEAELTYLFYTVEGHICVELRARQGAPPRVSKARRVVNALRRRAPRLGKARVRRGSQSSTSEMCSSQYLHSWVPGPS